MGCNTVVNAKTNTADCKICKASEPLPVPMEVNKFTDWLDAFNEKHYSCTNDKEIASVGANISDCGNYRYTLHRTINNQWQLSRKPCLFIMLNPSTADGNADDPTVKKCIKFAKREGCTSLTLVNLYALRATNPSELLENNKASGPHNGTHLVTEIEKNKGGLIILAWGSHKAVRDKEYLIPALLKVMTNEGFEPKCLAINKDGNPKHPLYVADNTQLINYTLDNL